MQSRLAWNSLHSPGWPCNTPAGVDHLSGFFFFLIDSYPKSNRFIPMVYIYFFQPHVFVDAVPLIFSFRLRLLTDISLFTMIVTY